MCDGFRLSLMWKQLLLLWSLSNALLASLVLSGGDASATFTGGGSNVTAVYMLVILGKCREDLCRKFKADGYGRSLCIGHGYLQIHMLHIVPHIQTLWRVAHHSKVDMQLTSRNGNIGHLPCIR